MPRRSRQRERVGWWHVAVSALGLVAANLLLRLGLRRRPGPVVPPRPPVVDDYDLGPRVIDHTPVPPEPRDVRTRPIVFFLVGIMLFFGLVTAAVTGLQWLQTGSPPTFFPPAAGVDDPDQGLPPPDPRVDELPENTLASVRATEAALLDYGWADQEAGLTRLPIERAMQLLAERGLPTAPGAESRRYADLIPHLPSDSSSGREEEQLWP